MFALFKHPTTQGSVLKIGFIKSNPLNKVGLLIVCFKLRTRVQFDVRSVNIRY